MSAEKSGETKYYTCCNSMHIPAIRWFYGILRSVAKGEAVIENEQKRRAGCVSGKMRRATQRLRKVHHKKSVI